MKLHSIIGGFSLLLYVLQVQTYAQYHWTEPQIIDSTRGVAPVGMTIDDSNNIFVTEGSLIFRSSDGGSSWQKIIFYSGELGEFIQDIGVDHSGNVWIVWDSMLDELSPTFINLSESKDTGRTFTTIFRSISYMDGAMSQKLAIDRDNNIYMLWDDDKLTFSKFPAGDPNQRLDTALPTDTTRIGLYPDLAVSDDFLIHCVWEGSWYDPGIKYRIGSYYSRSIDTGRTFTGFTKIDTSDYTDSLQYIDRPSLAVANGGAVYISHRILYTHSHGVGFIRSMNGGSSFSLPVHLSDTDMCESGSLCIDASGGINIAMENHTTNFFIRSTDGGETFSFQDSIYWYGYHAMKSDHQGNLYALFGRDMRIYIAKANLISSVSSSDAAPPTFALLPNYPNPFNPRTSITYTLPTQSYVTLKVFDLLGREIAILAQGKLDAGNHSAAWNANGIGSGVYFYKLEATSMTDGRRFTDVKKSLLIK